MHGLRFNRILSGTAIALVLSLATSAMANDQQNIDALVPIPEAADVPPPSLADVGGPATATIPPAPANEPATSNASLTAPATAPAPTVSAPAPQPAEAAPPAAKEIATPTPAPTPAPSAVAATDPAADALREVVTSVPKLSRLFDRKGERAAVEAFYAGRNYAPLWIANGAASDRTKAATAQFMAADLDGLDPADYPTPSFASSDPASLADAELRMTATVLTYARHAASGRVHYTRVNSDVAYSQANTPDPAEVLASMAKATDVGAALAAYQPPQPAYKALKAKLAEARANKGNAGPARIAHGQVLKLGKDKRGNATLMQDERVTQLRDRLGLPAVKDDLFYDKPLMDAVAAFQKQKKLPANGTLTAATVDALNGPKRDRDADIIVTNMERWRWLPRDLGKAHVILNVPDFTLQVYNNGASVWKTRVVVGKPGNHATPILTETMKYITVNPTWNVPPSIVYNEYLPALQQDPTVLKRMGLNLVQNKDGSVHISQPPGEANALGRIRFNFPNKFLVYQHDTPDKHLFAHERRAYSHGCMRVQDPAKYAEVLLGLALPKEGYTQEKIKSMYGRSEIDIKFPTPIPVHLTYQTAFVDDNGKLQIRDDVYGRDARLVAALKTEDRRVADLAIETRQQNYSRPSVRLPDSYSPSGPSFFERLFGSTPATPPAPVQRRRSVSTR